MAEIGKRLGVSHVTIHYDLIAVDTALRAGGDPHKLELLRQRQQATIDALISTHYPKRALKPSAEVILDALQHERKLHGLDRQNKDDRKFTWEQVDAMFMTFIRGLLGVFTASEERRAILGVMKDVSPQFVAHDALPSAPPASMSADA